MNDRTASALSPSIVRPERITLTWTGDGEAFSVTLPAAEHPALLRLLRVKRAEQLRREADALRSQAKALSDGADALDSPSSFQ